jgi:radical SAM superfamily enzyme YgiQ (UPF0313 family)
MAQIVITTFLTDSNRLVRYPGAYQVGWYVRQQGYDAQVLDFLYFMSKDQRMNLYKKYITSETKIVAWAPFMMGILDQKYDHGIGLAVDILKELKENFPWVKIVIGGQVVRWFLNTGYKHFNFKIDAVFDGEGEYTFLEYCDYIFKDTAHPKFELKNNHKVIKPSKSYNISSCNMKFEDRDFILPNESLPLELSRGCIFKCRFCQYPNIGKDKDDFNKSMDIIKENLIYHYEKFGITRYHLSDDTLNSHRERTKQFYEMTKTLPFKIEYIGYVRMDLLDIWPEQLDILPESGLTSCHFGVESLDPYSCIQIGKGWGAKNHKIWLPKILEYWGDKVILNCSLIAGLGKETEKDWEETYQWFVNSGVHDYFYQQLIISNLSMLSEFERNAGKYGYRWPDPVQYPGYWENDYTNYKRAAEWTKSKYNLDEFRKRIPSVWNYASFRTYGFTKEEILKSNYVDLNGARLKNKTLDKLINDYYNLAINY